MTVLHSAPRPVPVVLDGRYARLEPLDVSHAADLFAATSGEGSDERYRYLFETPPADIAELSAWIAKAAALPDYIHCAVIDKASGRCVGRQALMRIVPEHGVIEIGSILWGRGAARTRVASEAFYLFATHVFDALGYRRFEWKCNDRNEPSTRAARRFGFAFEGVFRQHMIIKGENRDTAWFSIIDGEWPALKTRFAAWLDPGNFDAQGIQKRAL